MSQEADETKPAPAFPEVPDAPPEGPRETLPDAPAPAPARGRPSPMIFLIVGLLVLSVVGPLVFYFFVWRYRPTAVQHVPEGTAVAARFDGRELYQYEPFRKHILGALDDPSGGAGRFDRFKHHTGIDLRSEVREVVVATGDGSSWVVMLGGNFTPARGTRTRFGDKLLAFLEEEGISGFEIDGAGVVHGRVHIAQAADSTLIVASSAEGAEAALEPSETYKQLGLIGSGAVSFVVDRPALDDLAHRPGAAALGLAKPFDHTKRVTGFVQLKREAKLYFDLEPEPGSGPEDLASELLAAQEKARLGQDGLPDLAGLTVAALKAGIKPRTGSVMIESEWERKRLDALLEETGAAIRAALAR